MTVDADTTNKHTNASYKHIRSTNMHQKSGPTGPTHCECEIPSILESGKVVKHGYHNIHHRKISLSLSNGA